MTTDKKTTKAQAGWMIRLDADEEKRVREYEAALTAGFRDAYPGIPIPTRGALLKGLMLAGLKVWEVA